MSNRNLERLLMGIVGGVCVAMLYWFCITWLVEILRQIMSALVLVAGG